MKNIELQELVGGALQEQFGKSFEKVIENLQNPNTPYKNSREIIIKLKFTQNEKRDDVKCGILVSEKLAAQAPLETSFAIGTDLKSGELYAEEYGKQVKGQTTFDDMKVEVNPETGEVTRMQNTKAEVIDLRKAMCN